MSIKSSKTASQVRTKSTSMESYSTHNSPTRASSQRSMFAQWKSPIQVWRLIRRLATSNSVHLSSSPVSLRTCPLARKLVILLGSTEQLLAYTSAKSNLRPTYFSTARGHFSRHKRLRINQRTSSLDLISSLESSCHSTTERCTSLDRRVSG